MARKYKTEMTRAQRAEHNKAMRKYTKSRREWERKMATGEISKDITLEQYRRNAGELPKHDSSDVTARLQGLSDGLTNLDKMLNRIMENVEKLEKLKLL